jgi:hypothetical protein
MISGMLVRCALGRKVKNKNSQDMPTVGNLNKAGDERWVTLCEQGW